jgi:hypothetical protein
MKTPTEFQLSQLMSVCDPVKAHEAYIKHREPNGQAPTSADPTGGQPMSPGTIVIDTRAKQKQALAAAVQKLEQKLQKLDQIVQQREQAAAAENRQSLARKERAVKEKDKPKSAAEKARIDRENKRFRDQQKLKNQALKHNGSSGGSSPKAKKDPGSEATLPELKSLATRVRGQLVLAKQKLAAL